MNRKIFFVLSFGYKTFFVIIWDFLTFVQIINHDNIKRCEMFDQFSDVNRNFQRMGSFKISENSLVNLSSIWCCPSRLFIIFITFYKYSSSCTSGHWIGEFYFIYFVNVPNLRRLDSLYTVVRNDGTRQ